MDIEQLVYVAGSLVCAAVIALFTTPFIKSLAIKVGAVDVPCDDRRMHTLPTPRLGGLSIFLGFMIAVCIFGNISGVFRGVFAGAVIIIILGIADDINPLTAKFKLLIQTIAASIAVISGVQIENLPNLNPFTQGSYMELPAWFSITVTILWIVGITNAVNFIDGLDGLAVGISGISCLSVLAIAVLVKEYNIAIFAAALAGACLGFMPFNTNPAKIFMGDTGATFLGFMIAVLSVQGLFKVYTVVAFAVPFLVLGLPIFDALFASIRRICSGRSPMSSDKEHLHHKLVGVGLSQKQAVAIMYFVSAILALTAVILTGDGIFKAIVVILVSLVICVVGAALVFTTPSNSLHLDKNLDSLSEDEMKNIIDDFNLISELQEPVWNHNNCYFPYLLKQVNDDCEVCLDIGSGKGELSYLLSQKSRKVIGIDISDKMVEKATFLYKDNKNLEFISKNILECEFDEESLDTIITTATAHHLPFEWLLNFAKVNLKKGGKLIILDLYKDQSFFDVLNSLAAFLPNICMNLLYNGRLHKDDPYSKELWRNHSKHDSYLTLNEVKMITSKYLPGAKIKRKLFWRYVLIWEKE